MLCEPVPYFLIEFLDRYLPPIYYHHCLVVVSLILWCCHHQNQHQLLHHHHQDHFKVGLLKKINDLEDDNQNSLDLFNNHASYRLGDGFYYTDRKSSWIKSNDDINSIYYISLEDIISKYIYVRYLCYLYLHQVDIEVITVETEHAGEVFPGSREDIRQYLEDQGYVHVYNLAGKKFSILIKSIIHDTYLYNYILILI